MFGCSRVVAYSLARQFEQTGISIDAQDRHDIRKQCQNKTVNLHSHIEISGTSRQLNCRCYKPQRFIPDDKNKNQTNAF